MSTGACVGRQRQNAEQDVFFVEAIFGFLQQNSQIQLVLVHTSLLLDYSRRIRKSKSLFFLELR